MSQLAVTERAVELPHTSTVVTPWHRVRLTTDSDPTHVDDIDVDTQRILRAAWTVLERSHFRSLKVRQVLGASNISASNFYRRFPSKSHLLLALLADETARTDRRLMAKIAEQDRPEDRLRAWLAFHIGTVYHRNRAERARLFLDPGLLDELPDQVRGLHEVTGRRLAEVIRDGVEQRVFRVADPVADVVMVQNLMRGLVANGLAGQLDMSEDDAVTTTYEFVLRALRPAALHAVQ